MLTADERERIQARARAAIGKRTMRSDPWWLQPATTFAVLGAFILYATWAAFQNADYYVEPYLSPFYSPCIAAICDHVTLPVVGDFWKISPALLILPFPLAFRMTCYYYRKAYYRSFWLSPPACAVGEPHGAYTGETRFPLIFQNVHRYAFYLALPFPLILLWDAIQGFRFPEGFGIGLGTGVLLLNAVLLGLYTVSCHSCRHLFGGHVNLFSKAPMRHRTWKLVSRLNERHMLFAWVSLVWVGLTDVYVRLVATGVISDPKVIF